MFARGAAGLVDVPTQEATLGPSKPLPMPHAPATRSSTLLGIHNYGCSTMLAMLALRAVDHDAIMGLSTRQ